MPVFEDHLGQVRFPYELRPDEAITAYYPNQSIENALRQLGLPLRSKIAPEASCGHGDVRGKAVPAPS